MNSDTYVVREQLKDPSKKNSFTLFEKTNIFYYVSGIMFYKFALETMNACLSGIVLNRVTKNSGTIWADMQGVNLIAQCIGTLLIGPFIKRYHSSSVLSTSILCFAVVAASIPLLEYFTKGKIPGALGSKNKSTWGTWDPLIIFAVYSLCGIFHGMVELMRRVIPADIVGENIHKLKRLDAIVHIFYEISGTVGSLLAYTWIGYFGWGYAFTLLPIGYTCAFVSWRMIQTRPSKVQEYKTYKDSVSNQSTLTYMSESFYSVFYSVWLGGKYIFTKRSLIWLVPTYTLPLILHRYLENTYFAFYAKSELKNSDYQTILTGGSNFGELLGALCVLLVAKRIRTPIPYLRLDAILLMVIWAFPYFKIYSKNYLGSAWSLSPLAAIISFGWAAGDVSLAAYVQSHLSKKSNTDKYTNPLGSVMSFLYVLYLALYYGLNRLMAMVRDSYTTDDKRGLYVLIGGVFFSVCSVIILLSTFIPKGAFALNPDDESDKNTPISDIEYIENPDMPALSLSERLRV